MLILYYTTDFYQICKQTQLIYNYSRKIQFNTLGKIKILLPIHLKELQLIQFKDY